MLRLDAVVAGYGGGDVLQGVDIEVAPQSVACIVGSQRRRQVDGAAYGQRTAQARGSARCCSTVSASTRSARRRSWPRGSARCRSRTRCSRP